jgi:hypothetical protein
MAQKTFAIGGGEEKKAADEKAAAADKAAIGQIDLKKVGAPTQQRGRETKLQQLGRQVISTLYMLVRNVKMYDPDNDIFVQPF